MAKYGAYDSEHELWFEWYLDELYDLGIIKHYRYQPKSIGLFDGLELEHIKELKTKSKFIPYNLLGEHVYTPDFYVEWNPDFSGVFYAIIQGKQVQKDKPFYAMNVDGKIFSLIDVKGGFNNPKMGDGRSFAMTQKWVWQKWGVYIQKVMVSNKGGIFRTTFTPGKFRFTPTGKERLIHYDPVQDLDKFLKNFKTREEMGV